MSRYFVEFSYDGSGYHGLQKQPNSITIQEVIENNFEKFIGSEINLVLAGRTDTGVHAKQMFAHFDIEKDFEKDIFCKRLNTMLPEDICIESINLVSNDKHARFDAVSRSYEYVISNEKNPFNNKFTYYFKEFLDLDKMNECCHYLLDQSDFKCFSKSNTDVKTYICDIKSAQWKEINNEYRFNITADRFLRNMVRSIVGTMIDVGRSRISNEGFKKILKSRNRSKAGFSAPASGLTLLSIKYNNIFIETWKK
ncbi:MAG: tRNA pseudouridine(38-40) synthase TruA [Bacteroidetes bacterium]|nr:tRNA pseudouridine(38-40) synthase TruA [Bacteroidota bacterium]